MNTSSFLSSVLSPFCLPFANTISHDIIRTTAVLTAVPRFDSTPEMPILPSTDVSAANTAEPTAYISQARLFVSPLSVFFSTIRIAPIPSIAEPVSLTARLSVSLKMIIASRIDITVLDLSIGTTLLTSPSESALK